MDNSKSDIILINKNKVMETGTSNLLFIKNKEVFGPKKDYYEGNTYKFLNTKIKKISKKNIYIKELNSYDEILLIGSGKGVASVKTIKEIGWKRKNLNQFNIFLKYYNLAIKKSKIYKF
jgi:branched-subunit amino acid aminotransferase/4-amino-4-deoxychorismate lyase